MTPATPPPTPTLTPEAGAREALWATVALLMSLWIGKHIAIGAAAPIIFTAIAAMQLYLPLWRIQGHGELPESHRIHAHGSLLGPLAVLRRHLVHARRRRGRAAWLPLLPASFDAQGRLQPRRRRRPTMELLASYARGAVWRPTPLLKDVGAALVLSAIVFPLFAVAHHGWQQLAGFHFKAFRVPDDMLRFWFDNTVLIALPEELFYRGFLETRLDRWWPTKRFVLGVPLSKTVFVASALFALGHFLGDYNPGRLGPFFPAFLFSALTRRSGSITGAIIFHGLCNSFSHLLAAGYGR